MSNHAEASLSSNAYRSCARLIPFAFLLLPAEIDGVMNPSSLATAIKAKALEIGFHKVGIARAGEVRSGGLLEEWLSRGFHGTMTWMENHREKRSDPREVLPDARSIVCVALNYYTPDSHSEDSSIGKISRYAWGDDYHEVVKDKLFLLLEAIRTLEPNVRGKCCADTAPVMDKYWAVEAGIGWQGKHSNVITRNLGSWIFLGEILLDVELKYDAPIKDYCGSCTKCIDACPTVAITQPYVVDSRRCISYLTIEYRGDEFPPDTAGQFENWIFGCDVCQDVCPWNKKFSQPTDITAFKQREANTTASLHELSRMTEEDFARRFATSAVKRAKLRGFLRNVLHAIRLV